MKTYLSLCLLLLLSACASHPPQPTQSENIPIPKFITFDGDPVLATLSRVGVDSYQISDICIGKKGFAPIDKACDRNSSNELQINLNNLQAHTHMNSYLGTSKCLAGLLNATKECQKNFVILKDSSIGMDWLVGKALGQKVTPVYDNEAIARAALQAIEKQNIDRETIIETLQTEYTAYQKEQSEKERAAYLASEKQKAQEKALRLKNSIDVFLNSKKAKFIIGDRVCSITNHFGYVEQVTPNKLKINVVGKREAPSDYAFFDPTINESEFRYKVIQNMVWDEPFSWSKCQFGY